MKVHAEVRHGAPAIPGQRSASAHRDGKVTSFFERRGVLTPPPSLLLCYLLVKDLLTVLFASQLLLD